MRSLSRIKFYARALRQLLARCKTRAARGTAVQGQDNKKIVGGWQALLAPYTWPAYIARRTRFSAKFMTDLRRKLSSWSSAAITVILPAPRAEAKPLSPCSSPPLGPKQRHRRARPRPSGEAAPPSPCSSSPLRPKQRNHRRAPPHLFGRSSAAITLLLPAPRAEATPPSPRSFPPLGPKQRRHHRAYPCSSGRSSAAIAVLLPAQPPHGRRQKARRDTEEPRERSKHGRPGSSKSGFPWGLKKRQPARKGGGRRVNTIAPQGPEGVSERGNLVAIRGWD